MTETTTGIEVPAGAIAVAISHISVGARVLDGTPPREAFSESYDQFFTGLAPQLGSSQLPPSVTRAIAGITPGAMARATALIPRLADVPGLEDQLASAMMAAFPRQQPGFAWLRDQYGGLAPGPRARAPSGPPHASSAPASRTPRRCG